jgi:hypothetical protein
MLKKFVITTTTPEYKQQMLQEFRDADVQIVNEKSDSLYNFNVMLDMSMESTVKDDSRVSAYRIGSKAENGMEYKSAASVEAYTAPIGGFPVTNETSWGHVVVSNQTDNLGASSTPVSARYERLLTGAGVDIVLPEPIYKLHPEFLDDFGNSRVVELNWPQVTGTTAQFPSWDMNDFYNPAYAIEANHGNATASTAAGRTFGLAKDALIYPMRMSQTVGTPFNGSHVVNLVRLWHLAKRAAGNMRPTVYISSYAVYWGGGSGAAYSAVYYRGQLYNITNNSTAAEKATVKIPSNLAAFQAPDPTYAADCKAAAAAGVIICVSGGNGGTYVDTFQGPDWENRLDSANGRQYCQGGNPSMASGVISVGNVSALLTSGRRTISPGSARGPGITIYAPGDSLLCAGASGTPQGPGGTWLGPGGGPLAWGTAYNGSTNPNFRMGRFSGTSASAPMVGGMVATFCEANPALDVNGAIALLQEFQRTDRIHQPAADFTNVASLYGDTGRFSLTPYATTKKTSIS